MNVYLGQLQDNCDDASASIGRFMVTLQVFTNRGRGDNPGL